ncbi:putative SGS domain, HSP20-like chaperone, tetratricopeptide-like helical domain-containing protein [Lupinus albus]|uniref:Putative SGS domain, HSP20-like chaperone, tetratricopeptide-like helical domain-containing protein n=1 Tax=Lupinus albus TaxID=3870 RepID=A0A6A4PYE1_LUPAL|nr:putative SGS domain, HSP20-like chaperone, tetratricopeptide-like helical domain-containing protein [Lupinus albus]
MEAREVEKKAKEAFFDDDFSAAVDLYSEAILLDPNNADLFADRAQTHIKLNCFTEAISDANKAIHFNPSLSKAYLRKGIACIKLEEYHTAKLALQTGASFAPNDSRFAKLIHECDRYIAEEPIGLTSTLSLNGPVAAVPPTDGSHLCDTSAGTTKEAERDSLVTQTNEVAPTGPKYRHEYYQKPEEVVVTIFAKRIPAKNVVVDFGEQILSVTIDVPGQGAYHYQPRLFGKIVPDKCRIEVLSTKVEIRLAKAEAINWTSLEYSKDVLPQKITTPTVQSERPTYPSSKPRTRDWDKLEAEVKKEEKEEKLDGDAALNKLFRDIYQSADEDMRRAMSKSFLESNGTVLSTDWKEVGSKKVEGSPPEGMELKKWEY